MHALYINVQVGLKYFDDLQRKIPREEVARVEATVRQACFDLVGACAPCSLALAACSQSDSWLCRACTSLGGCLSTSTEL